MAIEPNYNTRGAQNTNGSQMWEHSIQQKGDGEEVILVFGDANAGEKGWIVAEMPYHDLPQLQEEQQVRAMMISGAPLAYKVLADIKEDALGMVEQLKTVLGEYSPILGVFNSIALQADRALAYGPPSDEEE